MMSSREAMWGAQPVGDALQVYDGSRPGQGRVEPQLALGDEERAAVGRQVEQPGVDVRSGGGRQAQQQGHGADQVGVLGGGGPGEAEHVLAPPDGAQVRAVDGPHGLRGPHHARRHRRRPGRDPGRVTPGYEADFTIFGENPLRLTPERQAANPVIATVVDGRVQHTISTKAL